ncbi:MAG: ATP-binding cassette domain-containing protein [Alphaproteobacteria bacterium]|nr:ATP-binding cassette domain-containing protein [Alphaproteobacteria bacterium]
MKVELHGLRKSFDGTAALNGIDLTIADGEFLALLGPSGSGKTSLLRTLAGLEFPDAGVIAFDGNPVNDVPARARSIGFVFQQYALFRHMTVARNVAFGLNVLPRARRPARAEIARRVHALLELMGVGDLGGRYPSEISGGQRQRVALARALAIEPRLLLLDEPFGALDATVRRSLRVWLRRLHDRMKLTSIFVTHDQAEAMEMADRVAVLRAGRIEQVDTPDALYNAPATAFVHEFLGESIRLEGIASAGCLHLPGLPPMSIPQTQSAGPALALIRPHEIALLPGPGPARVRAVHANGPLRRISLMLGETALEVLQPIGDGAPNVGESYGLDISRAKIYLQSDRTDTQTPWPIAPPRVRDAFAASTIA